MAFYEAHGKENACGDGCQDWIAADGKIELDTAERLRRLLAQIHGPKPPIFFHSPGGSVRGSIELGRLLRAQKMTVSVGHTLPLNCDRNSAAKQSCAERVSNHLQVEAELDRLTAMCNSACVYTFAGGTTRLIPPWITLGIHDISIDPRARQSGLFAELVEREAGIALRKYLRQMGIDAELLTKAFAIPHTTIGRLPRDDAARFGLDRREFGETPWFYLDQGSPSIRKYFFLRTTTNPPRYINGAVVLACFKERNGIYALTYGREPLPTDEAGAPSQRPIVVSLNEKHISFARQSNDKLYLRSAGILSSVMDGIAAAASIVLPGGEFGREQEPAGDIALSMTGFSAMYATLQAACGRSAAQVSAMNQLNSKLPWFNTQVTGAPSMGTQLTLGTKRSVVDATLGAPVRTLGAISVYIDVNLASLNERRIAVVHFDPAGGLQRMAHYVLKDGKIVDEISKAELTEGEELPEVRLLLTNTNNAATDARAHPTPPAPSK